MNLKSIVRTYITHIRPQAQSELNWFQHQPSLKSAIEHTALAINSNGKRFSHQRRIKKEALVQARAVLLVNEEQIKDKESFAALIDYLKEMLEPIFGIGELYIYDSALRFGAILDLLPAKVYLHAGTRKGAKALGLNHKADSIDMSKLPAELKKLEPYEVEDVLCIFKDKLRKSEVKTSAEDMYKQSWCS